MRPSRFHLLALLAIPVSALGLCACGGPGSPGTSTGDGATGSNADSDAQNVSDGASGNSVDAESPEAESVSDAGASDSGTLPCGDASCGPSQICLYPACPPCAAGGGACQPPSCVSAGPGTGTFDCSGGDAGPACSSVNGPIPSNCSRVCSGFCA
jgi:hypothetical protein